MSIFQLITVLRSAFQMDDFGRVEKVLVDWDDRFKAEIGQLMEKIEIDRLRRIRAEEKLKKNELVYKNAIEELRNKNLELDYENFKLKELKKKWVDDSNDVGMLRSRVSELEDQHVDDKNNWAAVKIRNSELEEAARKNLATVNELTTENHILAYEKHGLEALVESLGRKFEELNGRVTRLEDDTGRLMSVDASYGSSCSSV